MEKAEVWDRNCMEHSGICFTEVHLLLHSPVGLKITSLSSEASV